MTTRQDEPGGANFWTPEEDIYLARNFTGYAAIQKISRALNRSESAVTKRIATAMAGDGNKRLELEKQACLLHSLDLLKSGGMFK